MTATSGKAHVFQSAVTSEDILPNDYLDRSNDEVGQFAMAGLDPDFARTVESGDFVVGHQAFGIGSSRETAAIALQLAGVGAVFAPGFGRVFYRNCVNIGLPAVQIEDTDSIEAGDRLTLDIDQRTVTNARTGQSYPILNLTGVALEILRAGGIVPYIKTRQLASGGPQNHD